MQNKRVVRLTARIIFYAIGVFCLAMVWVEIMDGGSPTADLILGPVHLDPRSDPPESVSESEYLSTEQSHADACRDDCSLLLCLCEK